MVAGLPRQFDNSRSHRRFPTIRPALAVSDNDGADFRGLHLQLDELISVVVDVLHGDNVILANLGAESVLGVHIVLDARRLFPA